MNSISLKMTNSLKWIFNTARRLWYISPVHSPLILLHDYSVTSSFLKPLTPSPSFSLSTDYLNRNNSNNQKRNSSKLQLYIYYLPAPLTMCHPFPSVPVGELSLFLLVLTPCGRKVKSWKVKPHPSGTAGLQGPLLSKSRGRTTQS